MSQQVNQYFLQNALTSVQSTLKHDNDAVANLFSQYQRDQFSINNLIQSISIMYETVVSKKGKIVLTGVGKSYKLAMKLVATLNSLSIEATSLHATEALHGDLGIIKDHDCLIMVTASGNTPELIGILPHITTVPVILLTCSRESQLSQHNQVNSLILAELLHYHKEEVIHGVPAPTISFGISMMIADAVILALSELIEADVIKRRKMFHSKHPGGSIGSNLSAEFNTNSGTTTIANSNLLSAPISTTISSNSSILSLKEIELESVSSDEREETLIKDITYKDLLKLSEINLLQWIVKYDSIKFFDHDGKMFMLSSDYIQNLYKKNYDGQNWDKFKWELIKKFG
ncbi:putative phosphosugar binding protein [Candida maltosa Xu316]|uniref:Putative phosphosugar binding protein n=1 Tax=Candida maltosa (strain Xu316) TaxID=1245528 RepID=M3HI31_CANMX|nr:putative phosphosugar binding protein [Candida maltosa Xu316]